MKGCIRLLCPSHFSDVDCCGVCASRNSDSGLCVKLDKGMDWMKTETVDHLVINNKMSTCLQYLLYLQYYLSRVTPTHICKSFSLKMKFIFALVVAESLQKFFNGASYHPTYHNNMKHFIHYILHYVKILCFITQLCNRFIIRRTIILVLLFGINFLNQHSTYNICVFWSNKIKNNENNERRWWKEAHGQMEVELWSILGSRPISWEWLYNDSHRQMLASTLCP